MRLNSFSKSSSPKARRKSSQWNRFKNNCLIQTIFNNRNAHGNIVSNWMYEQIRSITHLKRYNKQKSRGSENSQRNRFAGG